jgi:hypothetical protein
MRKDSIVQKDEKGSRSFYPEICPITRKWLVLLSKERSVARICANAIKNTVTLLRNAAMILSLRNTRKELIP